MKEIMWMLIAPADCRDLHTVIPAVAWIAKEKGVLFECYLECERNGDLFAKTGSTVISGHHFQQFNYLNNLYDVQYIFYGGPTYIFRSTIVLFGKEILAETEDADTLYRLLLGDSYDLYTAKVYGNLICGEKDYTPYIYPDIYFNRYLAYTDLTFADPFCDEDYCRTTSAIALQYADRAKGAAFGDPDAIRSMLPLLCREERVSLYGEIQYVPDDQVVFSQYAEMISSANHLTAQIAHKTGNLVLIGRQTGDGDLFEWSKQGVCMQIIDPNRPAFPAVKEMTHKWTDFPKTVYDAEPTDEELRQYAEEGKTLATVIVHSGEVAHNEAMIHFIDYVNYSGIKFGLGVHSARYETSPQFWELIQIPRENGGVLGYVEPVLHSGGMGVMAEINCPAEYLKKHMETSLARIREIAPGCCPKGYYAFCDTDLKTKTAIRPELFEVMRDCGLKYAITNITPGSNRTVFSLGEFAVLNQSESSLVPWSPFIRVPELERIKTEHDFSKPGWIIGTLDAPVVAFPSYIWNSGNVFDQVAKYYTENENIIPATPHTIYRYSKILREFF